MLEDLIQNYVKAKRDHDEATKLMHRAERLAWKHLAKRVGDERAYELAGVALADQRSIHAWRAKQRAAEAIVEAASGYDRFEKIMLGARMNCIDAEPFTAANDT